MRNRDLMKKGLRRENKLAERSSSSKKIESEMET